MKAKVNIPTRGKSNPPLKNLPPSSVLEEQTKKMEKQLQDLKDVLAEQAINRERGEGERWQTANRNLPIRNYAKNVLDSKPKGLSSTQQPNKSTLPLVMKTRKDIGSREKLSSREKLAPLIPLNQSNHSTPRGSYQQETGTQSQNDFFKDTLSGDLNLSKTSPSPIQKNKANSSINTSKLLESTGGKSAENNLKKALMSQKEMGEVDKFLQEIGLPQYIEAFKENGFDDLETVMEIQTKHLVDMKIPAGHQIKLSKRIGELRQNAPQKALTSTPPHKASQEVSSTNGINMEHIKSNSQGYYGQGGSDYIQLEEPKRDTAIGDDRKTGGELLQGTFNEAESHQSFLEALNEWRSGKNTKPVIAEKTEKREVIAKDSRSKKVRFAEPVKEIEKKEESDEEVVEYISTRAIKRQEEERKKEEKKPFFFAAGGGSWNPAEMNSQKESGTDMSPRSRQSKKTGCWSCYKLVPTEEAKVVGKKTFCSEECVKTYKDLNTKKCMKKGCVNTFLKEDGIIIEGRWYCSEKCAPSTEELLMEEQRMMKRFEEEDGVSRDFCGDERKDEDEDGGDEEEDEEEMAFDLSVNMGNKKEVLTLAELEEKYKNLNKNYEKI